MESFIEQKCTDWSGSLWTTLAPKGFDHFSVRDVDSLWAVKGNELYFCHDLDKCELNNAVSTLPTGWTIFPRNNVFSQIESSSGNSACIIKKDDNAVYCAELKV